MFRSIAFIEQNKFDEKNPLDIGMLFESMLFYQHTTVLASENMLKQMLRVLGIENFIQLLEEDFLRVIFRESYLAIKTETRGKESFYAPLTFTSPQHSLDQVLEKQCTELTGKRGKGHRIARHIKRKIPITKDENLPMEITTESFLDNNYLQKVVPILLKSLAPSAELDNAEFFTQRSGDGITINTNIDFARLNAIHYPKSLENPDPMNKGFLNPAQLLASLFTVEYNLFLSATYVSEIATDQATSQILTERLTYLTNKRTHSQQSIDRFQELTLGDARAMSHAINRKEINFDDVIRLIKKSHEFKAWVNGLSEDGDLIKEYYKEVARETFLEKLPPKTLRWLIFTGAGILIDALSTGVIATTTGVALGVLDTFLIDKMIKEWKPNQFIDNEVKKLVKQ